MVLYEAVGILVFIGLVMVGLNVVLAKVQGVAAADTKQPEQKDS